MHRRALLLALAVLVSLCVSYVIASRARSGTPGTLRPTAPEESDSGTSARSGSPPLATRIDNDSKGDPARSDSGAYKAERLEDFLSNAPRGKEGEWALSRMGTGNGGTPPAVVSQIVAETLVTDWMEHPPYRITVLLGESDVPWLKRFSATYLREHKRIAQDAPPEQRTALLRDHQYMGRQVLSATVRSRLQESADLSARFDDARPLRDLSGRDREWLDAMIESVDAYALWQDREILPEAYRSLLSARDLPFLRTLAQRAIASAHESPVRNDDKAGRAYVEGLAMELADYLRPRDDGSR